VTAKLSVGSMLLACVLTSLLGCASAPQVAVETRTVEVPVEVVRPIPAQLTDPIPYPDAEYTVSGLVDLIVELYDRLDQANADRATVKRLSGAP